MKTTRTLGGDHTIHGSWDDTYGNEVLIYWHPNGIHCHVFVMGGTDYGGGVLKEFPAKADEVNTVLERSESDTDFYCAMRDGEFK